MECMKIEYFKLSEFDARDADGKKIPGTGGQMRACTIEKCDKLREAYGNPLIVASGIRTPERNKQVGGVKNSSHLLGYAVDWKDIAPQPSEWDTELIAFLNAAWAAGFRRFGIMGGAIHVDSDATKPRPTMWDYSNTKGTARMKLAQDWFNSKLKG